MLYYVISYYYCIILYYIIIIITNTTPRKAPGRSPRPRAPHELGPSITAV